MEKNRRRDAPVSKYRTPFLLFYYKFIPNKKKPFISIALNNKKCVRKTFGPSASLSKTNVGSEKFTLSIDIQ